MIMWAALAYVAVAGVLFAAFSSSCVEVIGRHGVRPWFCWVLHGTLCLLWVVVVAFNLVSEIVQSRAHRKRERDGNEPLR